MTHTDQRTSEAAFIADVLNAEAEAISRIADRVVNDDLPHWNAAIDLLRGSDVMIESVAPHRFSLEDILVQVLADQAGAPSSPPVARPAGP